MGTERALVNAISVDVEDWLQSTIDPGLALTERFSRSTHKVVDAFAARGVRGTFFVLGLLIALRNWFYARRAARAAQRPAQAPSEATANA